MSSAFYSFIKIFLENLIRDSITYTEHANGFVDRTEEISRISRRIEN
jgi:hypothetical protein